MEKIEYIIARDSKTLANVLDHIEKPDSELWAFDIETNSVNEHEARVIGIAVCCLEDEGFYIPLAAWDGENLVPYYSASEELAIIKRLCKALSKKCLVMHNGVYDVATMKHFYDIDLTDALYADTILMKHTLDEERPFGLKDIGELVFGEDAKDEQLELTENVKSKGGKWTQKQKDMYMADMEVLGKYAIKDVILTLKLFYEFSDELERQGLEEFFYDKEVMPLYRKATIPMKLKGVFVDKEYFLKLKNELENDIMNLTDEVFDTVGDRIEPKVREILDKYVNASRIGQFAAKVLSYYNLPVPLNAKTGKPTFAKKELIALEVEYPKHPALEWILFNPKSEGEGPVLPDDIVYAIKKEIYTDKNPQNPNVFNFSSNQHLAWLLFTAYGKTPKSFSDKTGAPQVDKNAIGEYSDIPFIPKYQELRKQEKLLSTYVLPILEKETDGWIYPSMLQFGTTSGRYACAGGLNLQTLPRDDTRIKKGFIAPPGYKIVNADFSALEPRIFSWVSGDERLKEVWSKGEDLYSRVAIDVFGLEGVSAHPDDDNYLKKVDPKYRQLSKIFTLAVPYGAGPGRIASIMGVEYMEAANIVKTYLNSYPGLKTYMRTMEDDAIENGMVYTEFGRIRHLPLAKELYGRYKHAIKDKKRMQYVEEGNELYFKFRTLMNNAKNFPIQGSAAHVTNASLIMLSDLLGEHKVDGWIALQVHDEITCIVKEKDSERAAKLLQESMEDNWVAKAIDVPMIAEPIIANNLAEAK